MQEINNTQNGTFFSYSENFNHVKKLSIDNFIN